MYQTQCGSIVLLFRRFDLLGWNSWFAGKRLCCGLEGLWPLPSLLETALTSWDYGEMYIALLILLVESSTELQVVQVRDLHNLLQQSHSSQKSKNVEFLLTVEQIVHSMQGGRLTSCKSGKDRTGMAVTLEECCFLRNYHHLDSCAFNKTLSTIRRYSFFCVYV